MEKKIKKCDIVTISDNFRSDGFVIHEYMGFGEGCEYIVAEVRDGGVQIVGSRYLYPEEAFDPAPLEKGDIAYHENMGELRVIQQEEQTVTFQKGGDIIRLPRSELYKMKSFLKYYFENETEIYINNILFKLDTRKKF